MKIKLHSDDHLPLKKTLDEMVIVIRTVFHEDNEHHPQVF